MAPDKINSEIERITKLADKLSHELSDCRLRAAKNLLSKFQNNLVNNSILSSSLSFSRQLIYQIDVALNVIVTGSVSSFLDLPKDDTTCLQLILQLIKSVMQSSKSVFSSKQSQDDPLIAITNKLYAIRTLKDIDAITSDFLNQAIESVQTVSHTIAPPLHKFNQNESAQKVFTYQDPLTIRKDFKLPTHSLNAQCSQGAGSILFSSLCCFGWKLPEVVITEGDEKYLFDAEVRIKLFHPNSQDLLKDIVTDFPAQAIISRVGLLHSVIDLLGSATIYCVDEEPTKALTPPVILSWLQSVIEKCIAEFENLLAGDYLSDIPSLENTPLYDGTEEALSPSLALQLAKNMYQLRYPRSFTENEIRKFNELQTETNANQRLVSIAGLPPVPSLAGFAFSCCAASLPLLMTKSLDNGLAILSLSLKALPFIFEPITNSTIVLAETDKARLQHLLNRIEQILKSNSFQIDLSKIRSLSFNDQSYEPDSYGSFSFDLIIVRIIIEMVTVLPPHFYQASYDSNSLDEQKSFVEIFPRTMWLLKDLLIFCSPSGPFPKFDLVKNLLNNLDADLTLSIAMCKSIYFGARAMSSEETPTYLRTNDYTDLVTKCASLTSALLLDRFDKTHDPNEESTARVNRQGLTVLHSIIFFISDAKESTSNFFTCCFCGALTYRSLALDCIVGLLASINQPSNDTATLTHLSLVANQNLLNQLIDAFFSKFKSSEQAYERITQSPDCIFGLLTLNVIKLDEDLRSNVSQDLILGKSVIHKSLQLVNLLASYLIEHECIIVDASWADLLVPLQIVIWMFDNESLSVRYLSILKCKIEEACINRGNKNFQNLNVLGLFHCNKHVREFSALSLRQKIEVECVNDLFNNSNSLQLVKLSELTKSNDAPITHSKLSHSDLRNIASIAIAHSDSRIKCAALKQLKEILSGDIHLLMTAEADWLVDTAVSMLQILKDVASKGDSEIMQHLCSLLMLLAMNSAEVREFLSGSYDILFAAAFSSPVEVSSSISLLQLVAAIAFSGCSVSLSSFNFFQLDFNSKHASSSTLWVPSMLCSCFGFPISTKSKSDISVSPLSINFISGSESLSRLLDSDTNKCILDKLLQTKCYSDDPNDSESFSKALALSVSSRIKSANNHDTMNRALRCSLVTCRALEPNVAIATSKCIFEENRFLRLIRAPPRNPADEETFDLAMSFSVASKPFLSLSQLAAVVDCISIQVLPVIESIVNNSQLLDTNWKSGLGEQGMFSIASKVAKTLSDIHLNSQPDLNSQFENDARALQIKVLLKTLARISILERVPVNVRSDCFSSLIAILFTQGVFSSCGDDWLLEEDEEQNLSVLELILRTAKLLRVPDSFRFSSVTAKSLLLITSLNGTLSKFLTPECNTWTLSLLYNRSAEIKIYSIQLVKIMHCSNLITEDTISQLIRFASDRSESLALRADALEQVLNSLTFDSSNLVNLTQVIGCLANCYSDINSSVCSSGNWYSMALLSKCGLSLCRYVTSSNETMNNKLWDSMQSVKLLQLLTSVITQQLDSTLSNILGSSNTQKSDAIRTYCLGESNEDEKCDTLAYHWHELGSHIALRLRNDRLMALTYALECSLLIQSSAPTEVSEQLFNWYYNSPSDVPRTTVEHILSEVESIESSTLSSIQTAFIAIALQFITELIAFESESSSRNINISRSLKAMLQEKTHLADSLLSAATALIFSEATLTLSGSSFFDQSIISNSALRLGCSLISSKSWAGALFNKKKYVDSEVMDFAMSLLVWRKSIHDPRLLHQIDITLSLLMAATKDFDLSNLIVSDICENTTLLGQHISTALSIMNEPVENMSSSNSINSAAEALRTLKQKKDKIALGPQPGSPTKIECRMYKRREVSSPKSTSIVPTTTPSKQIKPSAGNVWRGKVRGYTYEKPKSNASKFNPRSVVNRLHLWTSLFFLQCASSSCVEMQEFIAKYSVACDTESDSSSLPGLPLAQAVVSVLGVWGRELDDSNFTHTSQPREPTFLDLTSAAMSMLAALVRENSNNKVLLASSKAATLAFRGSSSSKSAADQSSATGMLHFLLTRGVSTEIFVPHRWLCLQFAAACLDSSLSIIAKLSRQRAALAKIVSKHIEHATEAAGQTNSFEKLSVQNMTLAILVDALASTTASDESVSVAAKNRNESQDDWIDDSLSLPKLLDLVVHKTNFDPAVLSAVFRCVGRIAFKGSGKIVASAASDDVFTLLETAIDVEAQSNCSQQLQTIRTAALVALWALIHRSEQAKSRLKARGVAYWGLIENRFSDDKTASSALTSIRSMISAP